MAGTYLAPGSVQYLDLGINVIDGNAVPVQEICNRVERDYSDALMNDR